MLIFGPPMLGSYDDVAECCMSLCGLVVFSESFPGILLKSAVCVLPDIHCSCKLAFCPDASASDNLSSSVQAAGSAVQQLEQKLLNQGTNWRLRFLRAKRAPQESFSEQFKQLAR